MLTAVSQPPGTDVATAPRDESDFDLIGVVDTMFARYNMGAVNR
jgi:hypothetical protein